MIEELFGNILNLQWQQVVMWAIGGLLIWLAIKKQMEPSLLLPMGFGAILVNLPMSGAVTQIIDGVREVGPIDVLFNAGIANELFPLLLFVGIGAIDRLHTAALQPQDDDLRRGGAVRHLLHPLRGDAHGLEVKDAASIGIIGAADGPTSIVVANMFQSNYLGAIVVVAYSYMGAGAHRAAARHQAHHHQARAPHRMAYADRQVSKLTRILFPIIVHGAGRPCRPAQRRADRLFDVRQPDPRVRRAGRPF